MMHFVRHSGGCIEVGSGGCTHGGKLMAAIALTNGTEACASHGIETVSKAGCFIDAIDWALRVRDRSSHCHAEELPAVAVPDEQLA